MKFYNWDLEYLILWEESFDGAPVFIGEVYIPHWDKMQLNRILIFSIYVWQNIQHNCKFEHLLYEFCFIKIVFEKNILRKRPPQKRWAEIFTYFNMKKLELKSIHLVLFPLCLLIIPTTFDGFYSIKNVITCRRRGRREGTGGVGVAGLRCVATECGMTLGGGHTVQYTDLVSWKCTLETYMILLIKVTPVHLIKIKIKY